MPPADAKDALLELRGVVKRFANTTALDRFDLTVERGRTTVLLGPSGCGKSTALRMMIGLVDPDEGGIVVDGEPFPVEDRVALRRRVGYVIQDGGLFPHLTAAENVSLVARHLGQSETQIERRCRQLAELTHFPEDAWNRYPLELSGGQRQRVGLMRGLMLDPDLLLMDEPLGALDPMIRGDLQNDLRRIFRELGKTVVLVTHDLAEAAYLGDRIVLMREGRTIQAGAFEEFVRRPVDPFVTRFLRAHRGLPPLEGGS